MWIVGTLRHRRPGIPGAFANEIHHKWRSLSVAVIGELAQAAALLSQLDVATPNESFHVNLWEALSVALRKPDLGCPDRPRCLGRRESERL
jgi:hypothetical protein